MLRYSTCGGTSRTATVAVTTRGVPLLIFFFVFIGSETPRVVTATVAVLDVPPQVLLLNVTYGSSVGDGKSRGATGGLNSSEAWFIYLTFLYRDWGVLLHLVRVRVIPEAVRKIIEAAR